MDENTVKDKTGEELDMQKQALAEAEEKVAKAQAEADDLKSRIAAKELRMIALEESEISYNNYTGCGILAAGFGALTGGVAALIYAFKS